LITRGGAVPGWAAYNDSLDSHPLITKAMTSLVGWALGDFLAQVCYIC
jgi:protein Mpv17